MEANKDPQESPPPFFEQLTEYAETRIKLAKYKAIEGGTSFVASLVADLAVLFCMFLAFVFASITLALYLAHLFNSNWEGFGCVAIIYLLIALLVKYNKKSLEKPIINAFIQRILK